MLCSYGIEYPSSDLQSTYCPGKLMGWGEYVHRIHPTGDTSEHSLVWDIYCDELFPSDLC